MPKTMLFMLLLVGLSYQQCRIGCQKCASTDVCLLCDIVNNFILNNGTCSLSTQQNCRILTIGGNCAACNPGYYLDQTTFRCVVVANANIIANCLYYTATQTCSLCNTGRYISSGQCVAATTIVSDCNYYSENGKCAQCNTGFIFQHTLDVCVKIPNNLNCLTYTHVNCTTCSTGFIYNRNNHALVYSSDTGSYNLLRHLIEASTLWGGLSVCRPIEAQNCKSQNVFNECVSCNDGFYFKNKLCVAFPVNPIANCHVYTTATSCSTCVEFMYPINPSTCVNNTIIAKCIRYSASATSNTCMECEKDYFLNANACAIRVNSLAIADCIETVIAEDKCKTCAAGTTLTTDGLACLRSVLNCKEYVDSTKDTTNLICSQCNDEWYITLVVNNIVCVKGTVANCLLYNNGGTTAVQNICLTCKNGFYLSNKLCVAHTAVAKCTTYSQTEANVCTSCEVGHFPFHLTTNCVATTVIVNCRIYALDGLSCEKCLTGFYPSGKTCLAIPSTFSNCDLFDGVRCIKCNAEYMVNDVNLAGTCITLPDYLYPEDKSFCFDQLATTTQTPVWNDLVVANTEFYPLVCNSCATGTFPHLTLPNEAVCVKESQLNLYRGLQNPRDGNCKRYGLSYDKTNPYLVCMECNAGQFIKNYHLLAHFSGPYNSWNLNGITCGDCPITNTADNTNMIINDDLLGFVNICIPASTSKGYITNDAAPFKGCTRAARFNYANFPSPITDGFMNKHFVCTSTLVSSTPLTAIANLKNVLAINSGTVTLNAIYNPYRLAVDYKTGSTNYWSGSNTVPFNIFVQPTRYDWVQGYLPTDTGIYPSVFNYKGHLLELFPLAPTAPNGLITNVKIMKSYDNCEIFFQIVANRHENTVLSAASVNFNSFLPAANQPYLICLRCAFGYSLGFSSFTAGTPAADKPGFPSCSASKSLNCASAAVYGGLSTYMNTLISCHQCTTGRYPTLLIETDFTGSLATAFSRFRGWRTGFYGAGDTTVAALQNVFDCLPPAAGNDKITHSVDAASNSQATTITNFNCGVLGQILPLTSDRTVAVVVGTEIQNVCLACAANFFPTYYALASTGFNGIPGYNVMSCTASANCDTSIKTHFNSCARCTADSGTTYYAFIDSLLGGCVQVHSPNCFIAQIKDDGSGLDNTNPPNLCGVCKAGFFMNLDRRCEAIKIPNMGDAATFSIPVFSSYVWNKVRTEYKNKAIVANDNSANFPVLEYIRVHYLLAASGNPYGVSACKAGWIQAPASFWAANICVESPYLKANVLTTAPATKFIANCVRYLTQNNDAQSFVFFYPRAGQADPAGNKLKCEICKSGFVVNSAQDACVSSTLTNCLRLEGAVATTCEKCVSTHRLVAKVCVNAVIANCKTYLATATVNQAIDQCSVCNDGFVLADNFLTCTEGTIAFCAQYSGTPRVCNSCKAGYSLLITNTVRYCYPIPASSNCEIWHNAAHNSGLTHSTFSCARCINTASAAYGLRSWDHLPTLIPPTSCLPFQQIANCVEYNQGKLMITLNDFKCIKCTTNHYLVTTTGLCALRVNNSPNCMTFTTAADTCTTCNSGYYLSANAFTCVQNPPGIAGCLTYSDANVCTVCMTGFYLNLDHRCIPSTIVPNCKVYSGNWTCSACNNGFFLRNATDCVVPDATNCMEVDSLKACRNCAAGFGLSTTNGVTSCVSNAIINCASATQVAPFTCLVCSGNFYPGPAGTCLAVTTVITNCLVYDSATTCKTCSKGSVLSVLKTTCDNVRYATYIDGNCDASYLTAAPACAQCALGSYFAGELCTVCPNNGQSFGCLNCDPNNPNTCFLCSSGFYMNKNFLCIRNTNLPETPPTDTVPSPPTSSAKKAVAFTLGLGALFLEGL